MFYAADILDALQSRNDAHALRYNEKGKLPTVYHQSLPISTDN